MMTSDAPQAPMRRVLGLGPSADPGPPGGEGSGKKPPGMDKVVPTYERVTSS